MDDVRPETLVEEIARLDSRRSYPFVHPSNSNRIRIMEVVRPAGPVRVKRFDPSKGERQASAKAITITATAIADVAKALSGGRPVHVDSVLYNSGNTRSVLESLLAHTPQVYMAWPRSPTGRRVKHIVYRPQAAHPAGTFAECVLEGPMSVEAADPAGPATARRAAMGSSRDGSLRTHARMQSLLALVGHRLGADVWIARNDKGITGCDGRLGDLDGVVADLAAMEITKLKGVGESITHIDCAWFLKEGKSLPAVFEVEHSTGVVPGLSRMRNLMDQLPDGLQVRYVVVAEDSQFDKAAQIARRDQFVPLNALFLPYSELDFLGRICEQHGLRGASMEFLENFTRPLL